ncbi:ribbon-helix-helix domain-containing protein [Crocosphaera sp. Alani8]|uniref:ribbon-helix-helix domain-containing protein n=1 Tax=Crocosphaera sp. Alani8 TaxID=3038952 RepID=UPI00313D8ADE
MAVAGATVVRPKVTVYFNQDIYDWLNEKAEREVRSVANLVEYLVTKAKEEEISQKKNK